MDEPASDLVSIDAAGVTRPEGAVAIQRMRARGGRFHVLPAPAHLLVMRREDVEGETPGRACPLSGEVRTSGAICDIVSLIGHAGWRGEFVLLDATASRSLFFDQGQVVGAASTAERERLGQVLYRYGALTEAQVAACVEGSAEADLRFGEMAVKLGFLGREQLFHLMGRQTEEVFYATLLASRGMFYFLESYDEDQLSSRQSLSVSSLVREGVRRMHETRYFRARMPSDRHVPAPVIGKSEPDIDPLGVFATLDGRRSIADVCRLLGQSEFDVSRAIFQLVQAGHVLIKPPRLAVDEIVSVYNRALALILRELDAMDNGDQVRAELIAFAESSPLYRLVFEGAKAADDGTLSAALVAKNLPKLGPPAEAEERLGRALYDFASYALFIARPHVNRADAPRDGEPKSKARLSLRIAALLEPLAPPQGPPPAPEPPRKP